MESSGWVAVRCLFVDAAGSAARARRYEERITLWQADSANQAIALAEQEAVDYAHDVGCSYLGLAQSYLLANQPGGGAEVFSLVRDSALEPGEYLNTFFDTRSEHQQPAESG